MAQNMYRVGDYVYFEVSSTAPYQIRKIEELNKNATGQVEAKVMCFYRRRDISPALLKIADQAERKFEEFYEEDKLPGGYAPETGHTVAQTNGGGSAKKEETEGENGEAKEENGHEGHERNENETKKDDDELCASKREWGVAGLPLGAEVINDTDRHIMRQHELYVSRQMETLPATHIRGKCTVTLLSEVETCESYDREDAFFYSLMYDPTQMTLLADKGAIRVGDKFQAVVPETTELEDDLKKEEELEEEEEAKMNGDLMIAEEEGEGENGGEPSGERKRKEREVLVYHPHHSLSDRDIDQFLIIARAVGTFSRALDTSSSTKLPSLHMTAAAASRDVTLLHAMALLHQANYDVGQAVKFLVPPPSKQHYPLEADKCTSHKTVSLGGPILCRDQMEEWSPAEANLFEEAVEKYGKDFNDVRNDFLPWKSIRDIVEYYYMWKTTNRYVDVKKSKHTEQESKLKQVYIPNYNKPSPNLIGPPNTTGQPVPASKPCESCQTLLSLAWYSWGPSALQMRLCSDCWAHWKKFGGLRKRNEYEYYDLEGAPNDLLSGAQQQAARLSNTTVNPLAINKNIPVRGGVPLTGAAGRSQVVARLPPGHQSSLAAGGNGPMKQARPAFIMRSDPLTKMARRLAMKGGPLNIRKASRRPFEALSQTDIKAHCDKTDQTDLLKAATAVMKANAANLPPAVIQAITTGTLFVGTGKRPANGGSVDLGAPPAKKPAPMLA